MNKIVSVRVIGKSVKSFTASIVLFLMIGVCIVNGATRTASVSGNWNSTTTWGGRNVPTLADDVTINNGISVTVNAAAACNSLTTINAGVITISGTNTLSVTGLINMSRPGNNTSFTIAVGA